MTTYLIRRLSQALVVILLVTVGVFGLLHLLPGGPARAILGPKVSAEAIKEFEHANRLDQSFPRQYVHWLGGVVTGDLGYSYNLNQSVRTLIAQRLPRTLVLTTAGLLVSLIVGIPLGLRQAVRRNRLFDYTFTGFALVFYSTPIFFIGLLLVALFAVHWHVLPAQAPQGDSIGEILSDPLGFVLPVATLALVTIAMFARYMRSSTLENLVQDYVRTARAKGLSESAVVRSHVLRNALGPVVTLVGLFIPALFAGAVITESVFNYPGMGLLFWNAAQTRDYPTEIGVVLVVAVMTVIGSLLADITYAFLDPRIRYGR